MSPALARSTVPNPDRSTTRVCVPPSGSGPRSIVLCAPKRSAFCTSIRSAASSRLALTQPLAPPKQGRASENGMPLAPLARALLVSEKLMLLPNGVGSGLPSCRYGALTLTMALRLVSASSPARSRMLSAACSETSPSKSTASWA